MQHARFIEAIKAALENPHAESAAGGMLYDDERREALAQVIVQELIERGLCVEYVPSVAPSETAAPTVPTHKLETDWAAPFRSLPSSIAPPDAVAWGGNAHGLTALLEHNKRLTSELACMTDRWKLQCEDAENARLELAELQAATTRHTGYEPDCADCPTSAECRAAKRCAVMQSIRPTDGATTRK